MASKCLMRLVSVETSEPLAAGTYQLYLRPTSTATRWFLRRLPAWAWRMATEWGQTEAYGRVAFLGHYYDDEADYFVLRVLVVDPLTDQSVSAAAVPVAVTAAAIAVALIGAWGLLATLVGAAREVVSSPVSTGVLAVAVAGGALLMFGRARSRA